MKKLLMLLTLALTLTLLTGCAGTPVIYHIDCDCPTDTAAGTTPPAQNVPEAEGALKTGLAIVTDLGDSTDAAEDKEGEGKYDVTVAAVLVDGDGIIRDCKLDGISASVKFDAKGQITTDLTAAPKTKNELGENYGMVAYGGAVAEWDKQAASLAGFAVGKSVKELREGAVDESGKAPEGSDLASSATIYLAGYVSAIEKAAENAQSLGAEAGDRLSIAASSLIDGSTSAEDGKDGNAQLDVTATAVSLKDGVITSCAIDSVQAKIAFDSTGTVKSDITAAVQTKNELGEAYGMVAYAGAVAEWNEQAASFAAYVVGMNADEVKDIAVNEKTAPTDVDLSTSVTIAVGDFKELIIKAAK